MHSIEIDVPARLVRIELTRFWTAESLARFENDLGRRLRALAWRPGDYVALLDVRRRGVQSREMAEHVQRARHEDRRVLAPRRLAILVESALVKMQAQRVNRAGDGVFYDEAAALEWLASHDVPTP